MLSAHETFPGHHLLDTHRWNLKKTLRQPLEFPLFYEGWACFAEELLFHTGYFSLPEDRMILAQRHLWRAFRAKIELIIHTGRMSLDDAAGYLVRLGWNENQALNTVRKYTLKPGYQLCYTFGLRNFRRLFNQYGTENPRRFVSEIMTQGEIGFDDLAALFNKKIVA